MFYLFPLNKLKICFQSESHKNITINKQSRKFFVSPVKFTKVHVRRFVNEPTLLHVIVYNPFFYTNCILKHLKVYVQCKLRSHSLIHE